MGNESVSTRPTGMHSVATPCRRRRDMSKAAACKSDGVVPANIAARTTIPLAAEVVLADSTSEGSQNDADRDTTGLHAEVSATRLSRPTMHSRSMCELGMPMPPSSESWDWPLSRNEAKSRIAMIDHNELVTDKIELTEITRELLAHLRMAEEVRELREKMREAGRSN